MLNHTSHSGHPRACCPSHGLLDWSSLFPCLLDMEYWGQAEWLIRIPTPQTTELPFLPQGISLCRGPGCSAYSPAFLNCLLIAFLNCPWSSQLSPSLKAMFLPHNEEKNRDRIVYIKGEKNPPRPVGCGTVDETVVMRERSGMKDEQQGMEYRANVPHLDM